MRRPREGTNKSRPQYPDRDVRRSRRPPSLLTIWKGCINDGFFGFEFLMDKN